MFKAAVPRPAWAARTWRSHARSVSLQETWSFFADSNARRHISQSSSSQAQEATEPVLNKTSRIITQPKSQGASQAMLYATGLTTEDMNKAQVGISSVWYTGNPCNMHLLQLNHKIKEGVERAGLKGMQFNTIGVSDGISMGTKGMRYSLQSREIIADSIETVMGGQWYDANISIPGCDKNMPGVIMATVSYTHLTLPTKRIV